MADPDEEPESGVSHVPADDRFRRFEYPGRDFPFYNGLPIGISASQWLFLMVMVAVGFLALVVPFPVYTRDLGQFVPAILFFAIPLAGLVIVTPKHWTAIFRRISGGDILWIVVFAVINLVVSLGAAFVVEGVFGTTTNPAIYALAVMTTAERILFYLKTIPQLFGEEVLTVLPFLALLTLLTHRTRASRKVAIVATSLVVAIAFGLLHLPTYGWNIQQSVIVIGLARLVLLLPYLKTKNIWVSTGAHILNDWTLFTVALLGAGLASG
jgi:CAAX protease family protein